MSKNSIVPCGLISLLCVYSAFAQIHDQRAEDIQYGTAANFLSADGSFFKGDNFSTNSPYGYGYWVTAHALEGLADAYQRTRNPACQTRMKNIIAGIRKYNLYEQGTYRNDFYDDLEWLCLAAFNCYNATKDPEYLDAVHQIWAEIKSGYYGNVMAWKKGCPTCNNSIAQGPAIILAVKLYQLEGDPANLQMAKDIHAWMKAHVFNSQGGIWDSPDNFDVNWQFSYNSGMFIGACLALSTVTEQQSYVDDGIKASEFMMNYRMYEGGVFFLNEKGQGDGGLFKGIFAKWFADFVRMANLTEAQRDRYRHVINFTGNYAWNKGVDKSNFLINYDWGALPQDAIHLSTQISGVHLFEAEASLNKVHVYQGINYAGFYSQLLPGAYTLADLQSNGVVDNDIASITIPSGYAVIVYEQDNFNGESMIVTGNSNSLGAWNDRITSMKIVDMSASAAEAFGGSESGAFVTGLDIGNYNLESLMALGIEDNVIEAIKVKEGYKVIAYRDDNFTGQSLEITHETDVLGEFTMQVSSIQVKANGVTTLGDRTYYLKNRNSGLYMDVLDASTADGADVVQKLYNDGANQKFKFIHLGDGVYRVEANHSGLAISLAGGSEGNGIGIVQRKYLEDLSQQFIAVPSIEGHNKLIALQSGQVIEVANTSKLSGMHLHQWANHNQSSGDWKFILVSITALEEAESAGQLPIIYPNPTDGVLFFSSDLTGARMNIFSATGTLISRQQINGDHLNISSLAAGVYVVVIEQYGGGKVYNRIIKCDTRP